MILGTRALNDPDFVIEACRLFPRQIVVGVDVKDQMVAVEGWSKVSKITALELARKFENTGVSAIIYTDISRDGAMMGPNLSATLSLAASISIPIILSGGVSSTRDLTYIVAQCKEKKICLGGVISGRAVYEGLIDLTEAKRICNQGTQC